VAAGALDRPEQLRTGRVLAGPDLQLLVAVGAGRDDECGELTPDRVGQCGGVGVAVGVHANDGVELLHGCGVGGVQHLLPRRVGRPGCSIDGANL
jgi:hypothetical protein